MRPAPGVDGYAEGRFGNGNGGEGEGRGLRPIDTRRHDPEDPKSRESSTTRSPLTPRARSHASPAPYHHSLSHAGTSPPPPSGGAMLPAILALADPETAHLFPSALRPSASGPDLASLRRRAADERRRSTASPVSGRDQGNLVPNGAVVDGNGGQREGEGMEILHPSPRHHSDHTLPPPSDVPSHHTHSTSPNGAGPSGSGNAGIPMSGSARLEPRKAVGLQDFLFGEVIGKGSYSTVRALTLSFSPFFFSLLSLSDSARAALVVSCPGSFAVEGPLRWLWASVDCMVVDSGMRGEWCLARSPKGRSGEFHGSRIAVSSLFSCFGESFVQVLTDRCGKFVKWDFD